MQTGIAPAQVGRASFYVDGYTERLRTGLAGLDDCRADISDGENPVPFDRISVSTCALGSPDSDVDVEDVLGVDNLPFIDVQILI